MCVLLQFGFARSCRVRPSAKWSKARSGSGISSELFKMSQHKHPTALLRIFVACSPAYRNRRAIIEALGSIFIDTIEQQREYYFLQCPAMGEIFEDRVFNRSSFREVELFDTAQIETIKQLGFTYVVAGGDDMFVAEVLAKLGTHDATLVRLA
jgi:hypothetical protein